MVRDSSEYFRNNYTKFYNEVFFPTLKKEGVKTIIGLGDTFEDRKKMNILGIIANFIIIILSNYFLLPFHI
jgi:hypothetical protein